MSKPEHAGPPPDSASEAVLPDEPDDQPHATFKAFSRFNRDTSTWVAVSDVVLWGLAVRAVGCQGSQPGDAPATRSIRCWSCGCSTGEEAYYLSMIWSRRLASIFPEVSLSVLGTDLCAGNIAAAQRAVYSSHSLRSLPPLWCRDHFVSVGGGDAKASSPAARSASAGFSGPPEGGSLWRLKDTSVLGNVSFLQQDVTVERPEGSFDIILSRYAVCLYLEGEQKAAALTAMVAQLRPGGFLVLGSSDCLPLDFARQHGLTQLSYSVLNESSPWAPDKPLESIFRKDDGAANSAGPSQKEPADSRACASSYARFLRASGSEPDWILERDRVWRERIWEAGRMSDRSRVLLEKAAREGRRDASRGLLGRMSLDAEERRDRLRAAQAAQREAEVEEFQCARLPGPEAAEKIKSFFERMKQDLANREAFLKRAAKTSLVPITRPVSSPSRGGRRLAPLDAARLQSTPQRADGARSKSRKKSRRRRS